jgi:hypothetical protein
LGFAVVDDERVGVDGAEGADGGVDAADEKFFGAGENFAGAWAGEFCFLRGGHGAFLDLLQGLKPLDTRLVYVGAKAPTHKSE